MKGNFLLLKENDGRESIHLVLKLKYTVTGDLNIERGGTRIPSISVSASLKYLTNL